MMILLLVVGGVLLATVFMLGKLFVPRRMHAGYDRGVNSFFVNIMRLSVVVFALCMGYLILAANGIVR